MLTPTRLLALTVCLVSAALAQVAAVTVGSGVSSILGTRFIIAYFRNNFPNLVSLPPIANVHTFGPTGLIQEFNDAARDGAKAALIMPDQTKIGFDTDVLQVFPDIYTYYLAIGETSAGYPIEDTQTCPGGIVRCTFQRFSNMYALFAMPAGNPNGTQFSVSGAFYTKWTALNAIYGPLGVVMDMQRTLTSPVKTTASYQTFAGGTLFNVTSGTNKGQTFAVVGATDTLYESLNGGAGPLGLPLGDEIMLTGGIQRQLFEGGRIQYPTGGTPAVLFPVNEIQLSSPGPITLQSGQTFTLTAHLFDPFSQEEFGRTVTWTTTNGQVVSIQANGATAVLKALGSGYAMVSATSEGKVSAQFLVTVNAPCCGVGEGAPSVSIGQTFQDAVTRNKLVIQIPGPNPVIRLSTGYIQDLLSTDGTTHYLIAKGDRSGVAYVVSGAALAAYMQAGGPGGSLGFPLSDVSAGGTQLFENGALAGNPLRIVSGAVLAKWAALHYETGIAGTPVAAASNFTTASGYAGQSQAFSGGLIFGITTGNLAGQGFFLTGPILLRYQALNGPTGTLGLPTSDAFTTGGVQRQNFENGYIDLQAGAVSAQEHLVPRVPAISANPAFALAGSRVHLQISGFPDGATLRVSVSGQPDFTVQTQNGSYAYDFFIDASAPSATVAVHAVDIATGKTADGSYTIRTIADAKPNLTKSAGDNQTGTPGSLLPVPLAVVLKDGSGAPLAGVTVMFAASPGAAVTPVSVLTDLNGTASTNLRLPALAGLAAVTASSLGKIAIFDARTSGSPSNAAFPTFTQAVGAGNIGNGPDAIADKGGLLTAVAAIVRFYQNQGLVATPNGLADPNTLNQFLKNYCAPMTFSTLGALPAPLCDGFVSASASTEQVVNLWRVGAFVGGGLVPSVEQPSPGAIRDLVAAGSPVLLSLSLQEDSNPAGGAFVVATGVAADGSLQIFDPNPLLGRTALNDYLSGFTAAGHQWAGNILAALRFVPGPPALTGFVFSSISQTVLPLINAQSAAGSCGLPFNLLNAVSASGSAPMALLYSEFLYCNGTQPLYLADFTSSAPFSASVTDLAPGGGKQDLSSPTSTGYQITRAPNFSVQKPAVAFAAGGVVNAASFQPVLAPGEIVSIFGAGLSGPGSSTTVQVGDLPATVFVASPFQVNAQVPSGLAPGTYTLSVRSAYGISAQQVTLIAAAPGIFVLGSNPDGTSSGAIVNQNGSVNSSSNPAKRGETVVIYGTGLGAVTSASALPQTVIAVTVVLGGSALPVQYAGLTAGFAGLYQVNVTIPAATPPGLSLPLTLREGDQESNSVRIAVQ